VTRGVHIGFAAHARPEVDAFWREGVALGARDDGAPGPRPQYREEYYGGFLLDPDGNSIEAAQFVLDPDGNSVELVNHNR
jgi:catechol 2,3-dioxygenase-like lactoylglutathione lyase family enzyme